MKSRSKRIGFIAIFLVTAILAAGCGEKAEDKASAGQSGTEAEISVAESGDNASEQSESGNKMPAFTAKDLDGNTVTESIFGEKDLTVLNIWGTFCGPCIGEMPELGEWAAEMPDNVQMIGLVIDVAGDEDTEHHDLAVSIMQNAGADFTQIIANQDFADILKGVYGVPTTIFVDKDGNITGDPIIGADVEGYKKFVEDYLGEQ